MPAQTRPIPSHVSSVMSFPSTYHSPRTVKRKASEFVIGTVRDSSARPIQRSGPRDRREGGVWNLPAFPTSRKNQTLPDKFNTSGIAYRGLRSRPTILNSILAICRQSQGLLGSVMEGLVGVWNVMAALRRKGVVNPQQS